jgi:transcriptional regulator with XRE-family HTH domain
MGATEKEKDGAWKSLVECRKRIALNLRRARLHAGLTQKEAAELVGFNNPQTVGEIEAGRRSVRAEELQAFADAYYVDVRLLLPPPVARPGKARS